MRAVFRSTLAFCMGASALVLGSCGTPSDVLRYKMIVEVDTPTGLKTGFSVRELRLSYRDGLLDKIPFPAEGSQTSVKFQGEAVSVDIAPGRTLFALLKSADGNPDYSQTTVLRFAYPSAWETGIPLSPALPPAELWPNAPSSKWRGSSNPLPLLVSFGNDEDPESVILLDPNNLSSEFDKGVILKKISIQITHEPVTTGIRQRLKWLSEFPEPSLKSGHSFKDYSLAAVLRHGDFVRGEKK